jgi:hypothetical protein
VPVGSTSSTEMTFVDKLLKDASNYQTTNAAEKAEIENEYSTSSEVARFAIAMQSPRLRSAMQLMYAPLDRSGLDAKQSVDDEVSKAADPMNEVKLRMPSLIGLSILYNLISEDSRPSSFTHQPY